MSGNECPVIGKAKPPAVASDETVESSRRLGDVSPTFLAKTIVLFKSRRLVESSCRGTRH